LVASVAIKPFNSFREQAINYLQFVK